jgi:hypothetical protein
MGTNGSFDIATITDHFLLEMVYKEDYQIDISVDIYNKVGDDLWCYDPKGIILKTYTELCGIEINPSKTKSATEKNLCGEFVSRSLNNSHDVSRISANICRAVRKNLLDLPQLALHLSERECTFTLPLRSIFKSNKIKEQDQLVYIRTFYTLSLLHKRPGFKLLRDSLLSEFHDEIYADEYISMLKIFGVHIVRDSFNVYLISQLLNSIIEKSGRIFDSASEFDSSEILMEMADPSL